MAARVKLNSAGMADLLRDSGIRAELTARAERVLNEAQATAPVADGDYRDSLHIEQATTDRAVARVVAGTDHAWLVEAEHGTLARAMGAAG